MAVSDAMLGILTVMILNYFALVRHEMRLWRIIGSAGMILLGIVLVAVEDTIPMFAIAGISWIVAGATLFEDVATMSH